MGEWREFKLVLVEALGLSRDALHVLAGVLILLGICVVLRRSAGSRLPLMLTTLAAIANEVLDGVEHHFANPYSTRRLDHEWDIACTLFLPLLIFALARWTRVFERPRSGDKAQIAPPGDGAQRDDRDTL